MQELGKLVGTVALATVGGALTLLMWATIFQTSAGLLFVPITAALVIVKCIIVFVILPAAAVLVALPLIIATVAIVIPLTIAALALGAVGSLLVTIL